MDTLVSPTVPSIAPSVAEEESESVALLEALLDRLAERREGVSRSDPHAIPEKKEDEVISLWDKMLFGETSKSISEVNKAAPAPRKIAIPKKPQEKLSVSAVKIAQPMPPRKPGVPVKSGQQGDVEKSQPVASHYTGLLASIMRTQGVDEKKWEELKDRFATEILAEEGNEDLKQYLVSLRARKDPKEADPNPGETVWQYIERILPR